MAEGATVRAQLATELGSGRWSLSDARRAVWTGLDLERRSRDSAGTSSDAMGNDLARGLPAVWQRGQARPLARVPASEHHGETEGQNRATSIRHCRGRHSLEPRDASPVLHRLRQESEQIPSLFIYGRWEEGLFVLGAGRPQEVNRDHRLLDKKLDSVRGL